MKPQFVVAAGVVFTALSAIFVRLSVAPALAIAAWRMVFTVGMLLPLFIRERAGGPVRDYSNADGAATEPSPPTPRAAVLLSLASGTLLALHFALWITSLSYTSVASSTVLVTTHPIIVAVLGFLVLGERISLRSTMFILAALGGSVFLVWGGLGTGGSAPLGNLLALLGAVTVSGYILLGRVVRRRLSVNNYTMIVYTTAAALLVAAALLAGVPLAPYAPREFVIFAALALFCTLLGHSLFSWALKYLKPTVISTSILGEPVIASALAVVLFGEIPELSTLVGGGVILASIYLFVRQEARDARAAGIGHRSDHDDDL